MIAGILALLLIAYVFVGGGRAEADRAPHCTSAKALDQVKGELFRRAAAVRGTNDNVLNSVANYAVVRAGSRLLRRHHSGSNTVTCTGTLAVDLPPGAAVVGGRRSLAAQVAYDLQPGADGMPRLLMLSKAEDIVDPLATVSGAGGQAVPTAPPAAQTMQPRPNAEPMPPPPPPTTAPPKPSPAVKSPPTEQKPPIAARAKPRAPAPAPLSGPPKPSPQTKSSQTRKPTSVVSAAKPRRRAAEPPPAEVATAKPSFNCRYARTGGEIEVCRDPGLASLDREMSSQYYGAIAAASPGQKALLERTRKHFLAYRDSCGSDACIADAYRGRMREIADIMTGRW
jgi:outer membrane biosynthesis protein TonB